MTTLTIAILEYLRERGTASRIELEVHAAEIGYAPASACAILWRLKRTGRIEHVQRACRYTPSVYRRATEGAMKLGDIVRTPGANALYGNRPAIVTGIDAVGIQVHTGKFEVLYERDRLAPLATIEITKRTYRTLSGNRFRVCFLHVAGATQAQERHVLVGTKGSTPETRALEVRRLLFLSLVSEGGLGLTRAGAGEAPKNIGVSL